VREITQKQNRNLDLAGILYIIVPSLQLILTTGSRNGINVIVPPPAVLDRHDNATGQDIDFLDNKMRRAGIERGQIRLT